jgi:hypothetical protein
MRSSTTGIHILSKEPQAFRNKRMGGHKNESRWGRQRRHNLLPFLGGLPDEEKPGRREGWHTNKMLAEEDVRADLAEEQAGCRPRGESSSLSHSIFVNWFAHLYVPSLFPYSTYGRPIPFLQEFLFTARAGTCSSISCSTCMCMSIASR